MVAVKSFWEFWKNFSTGLSFSSICSLLSLNNNNNYDYKSKTSKHVKYNRLRTLRKSISSHFPVRSSSSIRSESLNCMKKSNSVDTHRNNNQNNKTSSESYHHPSHLHWNCTLDDSDTEFEDDNNEFVKELDAYHMRLAIEEISDFDDEDEALTCDVCDRSFPTAKRLADHQFKKRHYGCLQCDSIFPTRSALDHHREQMDHFDYAPPAYYGSDTTSFDSDDDENRILEIGCRR